MSLLITKLIIDVALAALLFGTIWYCKRLDTRIKILQDSKGELSKMIRQFDDTTEKAALCISEVHKVSQRVHENMRHHIDKANYIANDLSFMIDRGRKVSGMSEEELDTVSRGPRKRSDERAADTSGQTPASRSKESQPVQGGRRREDLSIEDKTMDDDNHKISRMIDALAQNKSENKEVEIEVIEPETISHEKPSGVKLRSKAEQELYEALRTNKVPRDES